MARLDIATPTLAQWLGRGARSGVGIAGFDHGGLLLDGGPERRRRAGPGVVAHPAAAGVARRGGAGQRAPGPVRRRRAQAIAALSPLPRALAADICHQVLMRVLPGAAGAEFAPFAAGINRIQQLLGEHFASAQGGSAFTSPAVGRLLDATSAGSAVRSLGTAPVRPPAIGQSSWGPTGFAIVPSQAQAEARASTPRAPAMVSTPSLTCASCAGRNNGASVIDRRAAPRAR